MTKLKDEKKPKRIKVRIRNKISKNYADFAQKYPRAAEVAESTVKVGTSKLALRISGIIGISVGLAFASGPAAAVPLAISLLTITAGIVADTMDVINTRRLKKENDLLVKHANSKLKEQAIIQNHLELAEILKDQLLPVKKKEFSNNTLSDSFSNKTDITGNIADNLAGAGDILIFLIKGEYAKSAKALAVTIYSLITGKDRREASNDVRNLLEKQIEVLRANDLTPAYNSEQELRQAVREQRIQQMALDKLSIEIYPPHSAGEAQIPKEEIRAKFAQYKNEIEAREKAVGQQSFTQQVKSFFKACLNAHDPSSQYYSQSTVKFLGLVQKINVGSGELTTELNEFKGKEFRRHQKESHLKQQQMEEISAQLSAAGQDIKFHKDERQPTIHSLSQKQQVSLGKAGQTLEKFVAPARMDKNTPAPAPLKKEEIRAK